MGVVSLAFSFGWRVFSAFLGSGLPAFGEGGGGEEGAPVVTPTGSSRSGFSVGWPLLGDASSLGFSDAGSSLAADGAAKIRKEDIGAHI